MASRYRIAPEADVVLLSFPMHFTWEFLQAPLFRSMESLSHFEGILICLQATLGDMAMVLVAFWVTCIVTGTRRWHVRPKALAIAVWLVSGLLMTVIIEFLSTGILDRWTYAAAMPRLPFLGTGLAPLGQWVVVPMIVLWYLNRLSPDPTD